ncbi:MAG: efflux RND transporter periplasmic adaptor subunit [Patescibacteria group bacterium]
MKKKTLELVNKLKKRKWPVVVLVLIIGAFGYAKFGRAEKGSDYKTATAQVQDLSETVSASGKVSANEEAVLKFQTSGKLAWVGVKKGDWVKKWQAVASLDKKALEKQFKQEMLDYMSERWDFEQTQDDYQETKDRHLVTDAIQRILDKAQFDLESIVLDAEISKLALDYATLVSPIEGIVTEIDTPYAGVNITPATATFVVSNPKKLVFKAKIDEVDIGKIQIGQLGELTLDAYPDEIIPVTVYQIAFNSSTTSGGGTAFEVSFLLPEDNLELKHKIGMNGDIEVIISQQEKVLVVPFEAVRGNGDKYLWVLENGQPVKKEVEIGFSTSSDTEIKSGISEGEMVITSGFQDLERKSR